MSEYLLVNTLCTVKSFNMNMVIGPNLVLLLIRFGLPIDGTVASRGQRFITFIGLFNSFF